MRKPKKRATVRIKRKNQNLRKQARNANKQKSKSFTRRVMDGELIVNESVPLYPH
jgi:hypothetical protein